MVLLILICGCQQKTKSVLAWMWDYPVIGSQSSPRTTDLNGDGVLDIVMGAGLNEYQHSEQGVIALDGKTGTLLWQQEASDQVYGSATFYDITGDDVSDVFIGGRSPHFKAIDGKTGQLIWEYNYADHQKDSILKYARYNFNNSVLVPDVNNDGLMDLLTVNGGNSLANPYSEIERYPAVLMIFDTRNGNIIAADTMPDGKESYMSPLCFAQPGSNEFMIVYGTGGETIDGNLYITSLSSLVNKELYKSKVIATEKGHGFIAPPSIADINKDGFLDIVAITHGSTAFAIDGQKHDILWQQSVPNTECSNSLAVGYFTPDDIPDFFTFTSKGQWPNSTGSMQIMFDGSNGSIAFTDTIGCTGFSSPAVYDIDSDGLDEAIISINEFDCNIGFTGNAPPAIQNKLIAVDFQTKSYQIIDQSQGFKNIFSTPWIGDIDDDGYLDIIHCQYYHRSLLLSFLGMRVKRIDLPIRMKSTPKWGSYMGTNGDGIFLGK